MNRPEGVFIPLLGRWHNKVDKNISVGSDHDYTV